MYLVQVSVQFRHSFEFGTTRRCSVLPLRHLTLKYYVASALSQLRAFNAFVLLANSVVP